MTDPSHKGESAGILARLRRRKVVQWSLAYVAGAWGLMQGIAYMRDTFGWPHELQQAATILLLIGLPIVVVVAWYHGDRGEQRVTRSELAILALLFLLGGGLFWRYQPISTTATPAVATSMPRPAAKTDARPSIAVLPFENRSRRDDDAFFVDGIHDDILTQLSKVGALRVISRTSVERFRGTRLPVQAIAEQLGVTKILEGGVQRAGDRVRINVQLIDAGSDAHLWAEDYDRELTAANIFAVQSEIASAIAGALRAALTTEERARVKAVPTQNLAAWEAYQLGRQRMANRSSSGLAEAEASFEKAISLDPKFARAYAGLADALVLKAGYAGAPKREDLEKAEHAAQQALVLDPNLAEAHASAGLIAQDRGQLDRAESMYRRAVMLDPNNALARQWLAGALQEQGRVQEGMAELEEALALDPLSPMINMNLGLMLFDQSRFDEAEARFLRIVEIDPSMPLSYAGLANLRAYGQGRAAEAIPLVEKALSLSDTPGGRCFLADLYLDVGEEARASKLVQSVQERWPDSACDVWHYSSPSATPSDRAATIRMARRLLASDPQDVTALALLRNSDLEAGHAPVARARYAAAFPELVTGTTPTIDWRNGVVALDIVPVLERTGATKQAKLLLDAMDTYRRQLAGPSRSGRRLTDARLLALQGDPDRALAALRDAKETGWRGPGWRYVRDVEPAFDAIRSRPEFKAVFDEIERDMAAQRAALAARPADTPSDRSAETGN